MNATKRTPQLRFPEFTGEWREIKFKDIFCRVTSKNKENNQNILTISAQHGFVSQDKFFSKIVAAKDVQGYYLLHENDYAYNKSYSKGYPVGAIKRLAQDKGVVSTLYICFSLKEPGGEAFFDQYFESGKHNREIQKIAQEGARNHGLLNISVDDFFDIKLIAPGAAEQQKIAAFLAAVDKRVALLERKMQQLEAYKHGVMQQLFSQQLRFTRPDGSYFPVWQERRLGEIGKFYRGLSYDKSNVRSFGNLVLRSSNIQGGQLILDQDLQFVDKAIGKQQNLRKGDIVICMANGSKKLVGKAAIYKGQYSGSITVGAFCSIFRSNNTLAEYLLQTHQYKKYLNMLLAGTNINNLKSSDLEKLKFILPSNEEEQQKITTFLSALDEKIALTRRQLDKTKQFKKGLLQRMFV